MTEQTLEQEFIDLTQDTIDNPEMEPVEEAKPAVPEKFSGKSLEDVVNSYSELEKELGRKSNEIGELRKLTDQLMGLQLESKKPDPQEEPVDFFDDPKKAVEQTVNPRIQRLENELMQERRVRALSEFQSKHPDYHEIGGSREFQEWVAKSNFRMEAFKRANNDDSPDFNAADDLLTEYKERKKLIESSTAQEEEKVKRQRDLKVATGESNSSAGSSRKVYRRADLIRLRMENPSKYEAMHDDILLAYQQGRVK